MSTAALAQNEAVSDLVKDAFKQEGYTVEVDGDEVIDKASLIEAVYQQVMKTLSRTKVEVQANAVPKADLTALVFPSTPAPGSPLFDEDNLDAVTAWKQLNTVVSGFVATGRSGKVQVLLGEREESERLVLCETKVGNSEIAAVYVTDSPDLIDRDFASARTDRLQRVSKNLAEDVAFAIKRQPAMKSKLTKKWDDHMKKATSDAKGVLALTAGPDES